VAIKRLTNTVNAGSVNEFYREAALCLAIRPHINVVRTYGMCQEPNNISLVMEWLPAGSLDGWLAKPENLLTPELCHKFAIGIASGMVR